MSQLSAEFKGLFAALATIWVVGAGAAEPAYNYTTKTPYKPLQALADYEPVPKGFRPVHTQLVARHGSRGMTSMKDDAALYNLWQQAQQEKALTPLGEALGPDLERLIHANALLGYGISGISKPGYGNLSQIGLEEHRQLAGRVLQRLPQLFGPLAKQAGNSAGAIRVLNSGVDRARDSASAFMGSLVALAPGLASQVVQPILDGYPDTAPAAQAPGTNRFLLYFHRLNAKTDLVTRENDPLLATYRHSEAYQAYQKSPRLAEKLHAIRHDARTAEVARTVMLRLFTPAFVERLEGGQIQSDNSATYTITSVDGLFTNRLAGDGKTQLRSAADALFALSSVVEIAPGLQRELGFDFNQYMPADAARLLSEANDAEDFYTKGPGILEDAPVTYAMSSALLKDFFEQAQAAGTGKVSPSATFRFTHAEILIPFASILGIRGMSEPLSYNEYYSYAKSKWRGADVAPYAANVQWDTFRNLKGELLVRMLHNEKETSFHPLCDAARLKSKSYFYRVDRLKKCYLKLMSAT